MTSYSGITDKAQLFPGILTRDKKFGMFCTRVLFGSTRPELVPT